MNSTIQMPPEVAAKTGGRCCDCRNAYSKHHYVYRVNGRLVCEGCASRYRWFAGKWVLDEPKRDQKLRDQPSLFDRPTACDRPTETQSATPVTQQVTQPKPDTTANQGELARNDTFFNRVRPELTDRQIAIYRFVVSTGFEGTTTDSISAAIGQPANAFSGRITELVNLKLVKRTKNRRMTRAGCMANVIVATEFYREVEEVKPQFLADAMPDQVTCSSTPRDDRGDLLCEGRQYTVFGYLVMCFEDGGTLFLQKCTRGGQAVPGSSPQRVDSLPANAKPVRVEFTR